MRLETEVKWIAGETCGTSGHEATITGAEPRVADGLAAL